MHLDSIPGCSFACRIADPLVATKLMWADPHRRDRWVDQGAKLVDKALLSGSVWEGDGWSYISEATSKGARKSGEKYPLASQMALREGVCICGLLPNPLQAERCT